MLEILEQLRNFKLGQAFCCPNTNTHYVVKYISKASDQVEAKNLSTGKLEVFDGTYLAKRP